MTLTQYQHTTCRTSLATILSRNRLRSLSIDLDTGFAVVPKHIGSCQQVFPLSAEWTGCVGLLNVPILSGVCQQVHVANTDVHRVLFIERDPCVPCSCRTAWSGSCMPRYTSTDHMPSRTIKQESMMNRNSRSNQSIVKVKPQPRPTQPCGWCQRMACTSHGRTQLYASCYAPQWTCKEESNSSVIARILHVLNPCW